MTNKCRFLKRAILGLCPNCGQGKIFSSYLKPANYCTMCKENLKRLKANNKAALLTIILVGHVIVPFLIIFYKYNYQPTLQIIAISGSISLILSFITLSKAKSLFLSLAWKLKNKSSSKRRNFR